MTRVKLPGFVDTPWRHAGDDMTDDGTAADFTRRLGDLRAAEGDVPMRHIFALAKEFSEMDPKQIEALLEASRPRITSRRGQCHGLRSTWPKDVGVAPPGAV